jgi:hypothetical protein
MKDWIPLLTKLVWPAIIAILLIAYKSEVKDVYSMILERIKEGGKVSIAGVLELGEIATKTEIKDLSLNNLSIEGGGGVTKDSSHELTKLQKQIENNPKKVINTLIIDDKIQYYSVSLLKQYISTLSLTYVVFLQQTKFIGWMNSGAFVVQLPPEDRDNFIKYDSLTAFNGINDYYIRPTASTKEVLEKMQELHIGSIPVVDENRQWLFFANREEILARLMTTILLSKNE